MSVEGAPEPVGRSIASAAAVIGLGNVTSRVLGLIREQVIAALFGATGPTSAFRTATRVSTAVYDLLLSGATTSALVPVFSDYIAAGRMSDLSRVVSTFVNLTIVGLGAIVALLILGAPALVSALGAEPGHFEMAVDLTRIALPSVLLLGISGIFTSVLYARRIFSVPAFASAAYNVGIILAAIALSGPFSIYGLTMGLALGALLQVAIQAPALRGLRYAPVIDLRHPGVRLVVRLYSPVFLGMLASYAVVVIDTNLAWRTGVDSVAAMAFATTLVQFPIGLVGAAASLAVLPTLSRLAASEAGGDDAAYVEVLVRGIKMVVLMIVPVAVALVILREPTVALLFQRLAFDSVATERTSMALLAYAPQLPFVVVDQLLIVAYYARKNTTTPALVGVGGAALYLAVALALVQPLGMPGLALANAVQNSAHAVVLYGLLARQHRELLSTSVASFALRVAIAGTISAIAVGAAAVALGPALGTDAVVPRGFGIVAASALAVGAYVIALVALRVGEARDALRLVRRAVRGLRFAGLR